MGIVKSLEKFRVVPDQLKPARLLSIDALRGFDMFWIMGGDFIFKSFDKIFDTPTTDFIYKQMDHVKWQGFNFYDIIMPLFLWIVGVSMPFSYTARLSTGKSKTSLWPHILRRFLILWVLGMMAQGNLLSYNSEFFKYYSNTLQAIAAGYFIASIVILYLNVAGQILTCGGLMLIYWFIMETISVPGYPAGMYLPEVNTALYIDKLILGIHQDGTNYTWIVSSLNFGATVLLGVFAGYMLKASCYKSTNKEKVLIPLVLTGAGLIAGGLLWSMIHPLIKTIWTGSFTLFSGGICFLLMALFYWLIEVIKTTGWSKIFVIIGVNSIIAYTVWHLFDFGLFADVFISGLKPYAGNAYDFFRALAAFLIMYFILWFMHRQKILVKI